MNLIHGNYPASARSPGRVKCLLVDDLEENLLALSALLRDHDVELLLARSGPQALELLLQHDVALAFIDVQMPDMDGFELAELIRGSERTRNIPLIFVTAGAADQHRLFKGYESGAVDFLYKPIEPRMLKHKADVFFQLHRMRQQLARDLADRTETLRFNESFVAMLGHELRNPVIAVLNYATLLERRYSSDEQIKSIALMLRESGKCMKQHLEDMADLARARLSGGLPLNAQPVDIGEVIQRVVDEHMAVYPSRQIEVEKTGTLGGKWDAIRISQLASNLIGNAIRHGEADTVIQVKLDGSAADEVQFSVTNSGEIPIDIRPYVFEPFRQGHPHAGGLGLGLYISKQIVQSHSGRIDLRAGTPGETSFLIRLPRES